MFKVSNSTYVNVFYVNALFRMDSYEVYLNLNGMMKWEPMYEIKLWNVGMFNLGIKGD